MVGARQGYEVRRLGPVDVAVMGRDEALAKVHEHVVAGKKLNVAYANTNLVNWAHWSPEVREGLKGFLVLNDGIGLTIGSLIYYGEGFVDNLNGTDFTPALLKALPSGVRVFLYGAEEDVVQKAARLLERELKVKVVGVQNGYAPVKDEVLVKTINAAKAEVVLVATGNPRQELWIARNSQALKANLCAGVGAYFDFVVGKFHRAPRWVQAWRLEWLYRLIQEPRRLAKRYLVDTIYFMWVVGRWRWI